MGHDMIKKKKSSLGQDEKKKSSLGQDEDILPNS